MAIASNAKISAAQIAKVTSVSRSWKGIGRRGSRFAGRRSGGNADSAASRRRRSARMTRATHHTHTTSSAASTNAFSGWPTAIESGMKRSAPTATMVATVALAITSRRRALIELRTCGASRQRAVEHLDHMEDREPRSARAKTGLDLQQAARVRADDRVRARREDRVDLAGQQPIGVLGLREVVRARAPAADVGVGHLEQLQAVHTCQQVARLLANALRVRQVAGILVRRAKVETPEALAGDVREVRAHVAHFRRKRGGARTPRVVVGEQRAVALELRTAARGIDDDRVDPRLLECRDVAARQGAGVLALAGVGVQRAAAGLQRRVDHRDSLTRKKATGRGVDVAVCDAHDAAEQQCDTCPRRRWLCGCGIPGPSERGIETLETPEATRHETQCTGRMDQRAQAQALVQAEDRRRASERPRVREHIESETAEATREPAAARTVLLCDVRARRLDEMAVWDTRRADPLARAACEAAVEMQARRVAGRSALEHADHQVDAAARRLRLETRDLIGRAGFETHPAVDALAKTRLDQAQGCDRHAMEASGTRPGARTPCGLNRCLSS